MKRRRNQEYHSFSIIIESVKDIRIDEKRRISFLRHKIVSFIFLVTDGLNEDRISRMKEESRIRVYLSFTVEGYQNQDGKKGISFFFFYQKILYPFFFIVANIKIVNRKEFFFFRHCEYSTIEVQNTFPPRRSKRIGNRDYLSFRYIVCSLFASAIRRHATFVYINLIGFIFIRLVSLSSLGVYIRQALQSSILINVPLDRVTDQSLVAYCRLWRVIIVDLFHSLEFDIIE